MAEQSNGRAKAMELANRQVHEIKRRLEQKRDDIMVLIDDDRGAVRLMMSALMRASDDPKIRECDPNSIVRAVVQAALCGADISAGLGEGYLIPYWNKDLGVKECQFMPGYRLGQRNIQEATGLRVVADVVREGDHWKHSQVPLVIEHTPAEKNRGEMLRSYAVALDDSGRVMFAQIATADDIEEAKKASRKGNEKDTPAWRNWEDRMWRKVAIMRLAKETRSWRPSPKLDHMLEAEDNSFTNNRAWVGELPEPRTPAIPELADGTHNFGKKVSHHTPPKEAQKPASPPAETTPATDGETKPEPTRAKLKRIRAAKDVVDLQAIYDDDDRKTIKDAVAAKLAQLNAGKKPAPPPPPPPEEEPPHDPETGVVTDEEPPPPSGTPGDFGF